jgi:L-alanine-DL-glutamate epimerase-like enolase superfamily enzyme
MSRIERVVVHATTIPLTRPFVTAVRATGELDTVLVELVDSDGRSGWGEAPASWRVTGESRPGIAAAVEGPIADAVLGHRITDLSATTAAVAAAVTRNSAARSAVDCALHDLAAQSAGLPLGQWLVAGRGPDAGSGLVAGSVPATAAASGPADVRTDMTISATDDHDALVGAALAHVASGFVTLKIKVGGSAAARDREGVRGVREAVGPGIRLRVDANQAWSVDQAVAVIRDWEDDGVGLEFVEQPVAARRLDLLAEVTKRVSTPVVADESVWDAADLRELVLREAATAVNIKLAKSGGLSEALAMVELAARCGIGVMVGCMMESTVGIGAAAALAATLPRGSTSGGADGAPTHDLDAGLWLAAPAVHGGPEYHGDRIRPASAPGLGITGAAGPVAGPAEKPMTGVGA